MFGNSVASSDITLTNLRSGSRGLRLRALQVSAQQRATILLYKYTSYRRVVIRQHESV